MLSKSVFFSYLHLLNDNFYLAIGPIFMCTFSIAVRGVFFINFQQKISSQF